MATNDQLTSNESADVGNSQSHMHRNSNGYLSKPFADYLPYQQLQILKCRLNFLRRCRPLKRPPSSLRINGANVIDSTIRLAKFSQWESELLELGISELMNDVRTLELKCKEEKAVKMYLTSTDQNSIRKHFKKKLDFFTSQNDKKWLLWPQKARIVSPNNDKNSRKRRNFKKRLNRKRRRTNHDAKMALENGSVIVLVNEEIPLGAIALLGKGLGFIPTSKLDTEDLRLDMRLFTNRIRKASKKSLEQMPEGTSAPTEETRNFYLPPRLQRKFYGVLEDSPEQAVNNILDHMNTELDHKLKQRKVTNMKSKENLTNDERKGLKWLTEMINDNKLAIVQADKGGAILIMYPDLLKKKVLEKLEDTELYTKLPKDPTKELSDQLFKLWVEGKQKGYVSPEEAKTVMGISNNLNKEGTGPTNRPSTLPHYKPGKAYFYPSVKIHKLDKDLLKPGVNPPIRLITALQEGI